MSAACPKGHTSEALDYCGVCGTPMTTALPSAEVTVERCPNCGSPPGSATACVECGYLLGTLDVVAPWEEENWEILVRPDRAFYESQEPDGMDFPEQTSTRRFLLTGDHVRIGRHSSSRKIEAEIDLSGALEDTGVSHRHAVLMRQPEGNWALVDLDSTNGTFLNADAEPILANHPIALSDGDQIHIGGWTTLTIERLDPASVARLEAESRPSKDTRNLARGRRPWEVGLLGPLRLVVSGQEVPITAAKTRAVLALLALRVGAPMSVPDLEWALWGEDEPKTAGTALRGYIASLRKLLPDRAIETTPQGAYRLVGSKYSVDVFRFERQCALGHSVLFSGHPGAAAAELTRALELWRGEPLLDLADGPAGGAVEVVGLVERRATAEEDLFEARLQLGDHQNLVADLRPAVDAEPLRQRRWAQLMLALHRCGRQAEALSSFQRLRSLLAEHGLEPSAELMELDQGIAFERAELAWTAPTEAGGAPPPVVSS
jgi:DNA-binding SARP family transcriptional activator/pSer/pThr/pTyr-binding forkhead associated (FHA) protein